MPLLSGFFSKDQILAAAWGSSKPLWVVGILTAGLTACYMTRLLLLTFWGDFRGSEEQREHLHESPAVMTWCRGRRTRRTTPAWPWSSC